jgi:hypothetical protein
MSNARLATLDARLHRRFAAAKLADTATYTGIAEGASPIPARVMVDDDVAQVGELSRLSGSWARITLLRADIAAPARGARVVVGALTFELEQMIRQDAGSTEWEASRVY